MPNSFVTYTKLCSLGVIAGTLIIGCSSEPSQYATPAPGSVVCRWEAPSGSSIRQRICFQVRSADERKEENEYARERIEDIQTSRPSYPAPRPQ